MKLNNQWHPKARVKIRRKMKHIPSELGNSEFFTKGEIGDTAGAAWGALLDKYPSFDCEGTTITDQFDRIVVLHHYLNKLKIARSKVEDAIKAGDISLCVAR